MKEKQKYYGNSGPESHKGFDLTPQARAIWKNIPGNMKIKRLKSYALDALDWMGSLKDKPVPPEESGKIQSASRKSSYFAAGDASFVVSFKRNQKQVLL